MFANLNVTQEIDKQLNYDEKTKKKVEEETPDDFSALKIDKSFVPTANWNFHMDPTKMSYLVNPKNLDAIHDKVKEEALNKLKKINEPSVIETDSEYSSDSSFDQNILTENEDQIIAAEKETKRKQNDDYYRIDFENIKFLQYELKKDFIVEVGEWPKESQVDSKCKKPDELQKKEGDNEKDETAGANKENPEGTEEEMVDQGKEGILVKQIEYALSKEETQPTITRMKWFSFFVFLIYIGFASLFLALFLNSMSVMTENVNVIEESYNLIENTIYSIFHTREVVLLNNPKYTNIYQAKPEYIKNNTDTLLSLFSTSYMLIIGVVTSTLAVNTANYFSLNNSTIFSTIIQDDLTIKKFNLTLNSEFTETTTALYHIGHLGINDLIATNKDVFFFLYNSLNDVSLKLYERALIYMEELGFNASAYKLVFLYIFIGALIFGIISYFICSYSYVAVEKRKESYLEVFFEISPAVIKQSLEKCEEFSRKTQQEGASDLVSNLDEAELNGEDGSANANNAIKKSSSVRKKGTTNSKEARIIKIKLGFGIVFVSVFFFLVYFMYQSYLNDIQIYTQIFQMVCLEQTKYLSLFNTLREYFFDVNNHVDMKVVKDIITDDLNDIYSFKLMQDTVRIFD